MLRKLLSKLPGNRAEVPMWKSFLQSIALLAIAMTAALYSTSAAHSGEMVGAIGAALLALGIAGWVGLRLVPRLARGVDWAWLPSLTQIKITREGAVFFGALVIVFSAALNTSNNLLYMVLSGLLAVLALAALLSASNFKRLETELVLPDRTFVGEEFPITVRVRNPRWLFPAFSLFADAPGASLYFQIIPPRGMANQSAKSRFARRGRHGFQKLKMSSGFPFGFFTKSHNHQVGAECICYPGILPQEQLEVTVADVLGAYHRPERGMGNDLHSVRDYVPSDSARHVHWKASAKTASLKTREFAAEDQRRVVITLDRFGGPEDGALFENLVTQAASIAFHLIQSGTEVALISDNWESPSGTGEGALNEILDYLALVEMSPAAGQPATNPHGTPLVLSLRHAIRQGDAA